MRLMIDTASLQEIEEAMTWGIDAVTANATMYRKEAITLYEFLTHVEALPHSFLCAEVIGSYEEMYKQALSLHEQYPDVVIKINYSAEGLRLAAALSRKQITTAMTLIFTVSQAVLAVQSGCRYIFCFVGRNDENGQDGLQVLNRICHATAGSDVHVVGASIKNLHQLEEAAVMGVSYAALSFHLLKKTMENTLTISGSRMFEDDWNQLKNL